MNTTNLHWRNQQIILQACHVFLSSFSSAALQLFEWKLMCRCFGSVRNRQMCNSGARRLFWWKAERPRRLFGCLWDVTLHQQKMDKLVTSKCGRLFPQHLTASDRKLPQGWKQQFVGQKHVASFLLRHWMAHFFSVLWLYGWLCEGPLKS